MIKPKDLIPHITKVKVINNDTWPFIKGDILLCVGIKICSEDYAYIIVEAKGYGNGMLIGTDNVEIFYNLNYNVAQVKSELSRIEALLCLN